MRRAWQRELILNDIRGEVPTSEYEKQIDELRTALITVEGSRSWKYSRKVAKVGKAGLRTARSLRDRVPEPVERSLVRRRHLRHVTANMGHLTDAAYLGSPPPDVVGWITPDGLPPAPESGFDLLSFTEADARAARAWIDAGPYDTDALLDRRTDIVSLPWVNHRSRRWEPEPLRWVGANVGLQVMTSADSVEARTGRPSRRAAMFARKIGH